MTIALARDDLQPLSLLIQTATLSKLTVGEFDASIQACNSDHSLHLKCFISAVLDLSQWPADLFSSFLGDTRSKAQTRATMAIARPVRALFALAALTWCFFIFQLLKPSPEFHGPGDRYLNFERDPNLDRELTRPTLTTNHTDESQQLANQKESLYEHPNVMRPMPKAKTRTELMLRFWHWSGTRRLTTWFSP